MSSIVSGGAGAQMTKSEQFRVRATECEQKAKEVKDGEAKGIYEDLAEQWHRIANQYEHYGWDG